MAFSATEKGYAIDTRGLRLPIFSDSVPPQPWVGSSVVEQGPFKPKVAGPIPARPTILCSRDGWQAIQIKKPVEPAFLFSLDLLVPTSYHGLRTITYKVRVSTTYKTERFRTWSSWYLLKNRPCCSSASTNQSATKLCTLRATFHFSPYSNFF